MTQFEIFDNFALMTTGDKQRGCLVGQSNIRPDNIFSTDTKL